MTITDSGGGTGSAGATAVADLSSLNLNYTLNGAAVTVINSTQFMLTTAQNVNSPYVPFSQPPTLLNSIDLTGSTPYIVLADGPSTLPVGDAILADVECGINTWVNTDPSRTPCTLQLVKVIEEGIRNGRFKPGDALPVRARWPTTLASIATRRSAAYKELEAEGWIEVAPEGTFVAQRLPLVLEGRWASPPRIPPPGSGPRPAVSPSTSRGPPALESFQLIPDTPDLRLTPTDAIHRAYGRVLKLHPERLLQPGWDPRGVLDLRNSLCQMLRDMRGLSVEAGNLLLTRGLMSTLNLVARVLFAPGDAVAVENPGWFRVAEAFRASGARLFPSPWTTTG